MQDFQLISQFKTIQENGKTMQGNALNYEVNTENRNTGKLTIHQTQTHGCDFEGLSGGNLRLPLLPLSGRSHIDQGNLFCGVVINPVQNSSIGDLVAH